MLHTTAGFVGVNEHFKNNIKIERILQIMQSLALGWTIIILFLVNIMYTLVYMCMYILWPGSPGTNLQGEQDCFGAPETDWDFSQNWGFDVQ